MARPQSRQQGLVDGSGAAAVFRRDSAPKGKVAMTTDRSRGRWHRIGDCIAESGREHTQTALPVEGKINSTNHRRCHQFTPIGGGGIGCVIAGPCAHLWHYLNVVSSQRILRRGYSPVLRMCCAHKKKDNLCTQVPGMFGTTQWQLSQMGASISRDEGIYPVALHIYTRHQ